MTTWKFFVFSCCLACCVSCAAFGTKIHVTKPDAIHKIKTVAVWPVTAIPVMKEVADKHPEVVDFAMQTDPGFPALAEAMSALADTALAQELNLCGWFSAITADSLTKVILDYDPAFSRLKKPDWRTYQEVIETDGLVVTQLAFGGESGGVNTYVTLFLYDLNTGDEVIQVKFNTKWGKSYLMPQQVDKTLPDAIHGAVVGLAKASRNHAKVKPD